MANSSASHEPQFLQQLVETGKKAFGPTEDAATRAVGQKEYEELLERVDDWTLISSLNTLIKPGTLPQWLREPLLQTLAELPLRPKGVRSTLEFVFSVHPSTQNQAGSSTPQKDGASITHEAVAAATKLLSSPPQKMTPQVWFGGISSQLFSLIDGDAGQDLAKTAAQVVGFGILGRKQYGAPGTPGWNVFVQPVLETINPSLNGLLLDQAHSSSTDEGVVDLARPKVVIDSKALKIALHRLRVLVMSNPSPGLCARLLKPVLLQLWSISSWIGPSAVTKRQFTDVAHILIQTYVKLFGKLENIRPILENLLVKGSLDLEKDLWIFAEESTGLTIILQKQQDSAELSVEDVSLKAGAFVDILISQASAEDISSVFLHLMRKWISGMGQNSEIIISIAQEASSIDSPIQNLVDITVLQKLMDKAPEQLVAHFAQLLDLITQVLQADAKSPLDEDLLSTVLSLLNLVITAPNFQRSDVNPEELKFVEESLDMLSSQSRAGVADTARNLSLLLRYHDELEPAEEKSTTTPSSRQIEDRKTYNLAMSYITGAGENPPPVVSEGLNMISDLIIAQSPALDIMTVITLMCTLLKDNEDYINLRVIKIFTHLANKHPKTTINELLDHYLDAREAVSTDTRLRFGEALLQVIEKLGETFSGETAQRAGEILLSIAGRRGHRPKTMARQIKDEKLKDLKRRKGQASVAEEEEEDMDMDENITEEEKANNDILAQIVQGWESKRGSEDIRMRTSALSIFGSSLEVNIAGIGATLVASSVDLCVNILTLEREMEQGILRRAAIITILNFVKAISQAREAKKSLGFGLTDQSREDIRRTLEYVAATDNDGLVKEHATEVVEILDILQSGAMGGLLSEQQAARGGSGLSSLSGLVVNPVTTINEDVVGKHPGIEEID